MKELRIKLDAILPTLAMASSVVPLKSALPILNDFRVETKDDGKGGIYMIVTASDSETWLQTKTETQHSDIGIDFCVDAKALLQALRNLDDESVTLFVDDSAHVVTCKYSNGHFTLPTDDASQYPNPTQLNNQNDGIKKRIAANRILSAIEKAGFATANDELRPVMNGIHFDFKQNGMVAVASDGQKLAKYIDLTLGNGDDATVYGFTMPKKPSHILMNVLSTQGENDVMLEFTERVAVVNNKSFRMVTRLIEGRYPNYDSVIPTDNENVVVIDKSMLASALKRVSPMSNMVSELLLFQVTKDSVKINAEDVDFSKKASEIVPCEYNGAEMSIGFKSSALSQVISNIRGNKVRIELKDSMRACLLREIHESGDCDYDYVSLLMPMIVA